MHVALLCTGVLKPVQLAKCRANVILWDINENGLLSVVDELKEEFPQGQFWHYTVDISDRNEVGSISHSEAD